MFFFFNDTATTEIYTLSLHDALPIWLHGESAAPECWGQARGGRSTRQHEPRIFGIAARSGHWMILKIHRDRKSTRLNSSHGYISYAVFCLQKHKKCSLKFARLLFACH